MQVPLCNSTKHLTRQPSFQGSLLLVPRERERETGRSSSLGSERENLGTRLRTKPEQDLKMAYVSGTMTKCLPREFSANHCKRVEHRHY